MSAVDLFGLLVPVTYLVMLGTEALFPAREFPAIPYWRLKGFAFLTVQGLLATLTPLLIPEHWLQAHRLINLENLGVIGGAALGYAVVSLISYAWHHSAHTLSLDVAAVSPDPPQPAADGHVRRGSIPSVRDGRLSPDRNRDDDADPRPRSGRGRAGRLHRGVLRLLPAHEYPHAAMARLCHPAAGGALHPPSARRARL
jgi:hypothetical protein